MMIVRRAYEKITRMCVALGCFTDIPAPTLAEYTCIGRLTSFTPCNSGTYSSCNFYTCYTATYGDFYVNTTRCLKTISEGISAIDSESITAIVCWWIQGVYSGSNGACAANKGIYRLLFPRFSSFFQTGKLPAGSPAVVLLVSVV